MRNYDIGVLATSQEYFHVASIFAKKTLFYLISGGDYQCDDTYTVVKGGMPESFYVMLVQKGTLHIEMNGRTYMAPQGTVFVLDSKIDCHYYAKARLSMQWIQFSGIMVQNFFDMLYENNEQNGPVFYIDDIMAMSKKFSFIMNMFAANQINEFQGSLSLHDILTTLTLLNPLSQEDTNLSMIEVARYIDKFYSENLTVQNLAKGCNLSVYYFIRAFQQVHGCTPHQYLASVRFDSAKHLLLTSNLSVEKIGEIVGFSSGSNFARAFKKEFGYSPTEFRDYTPSATR